MRQRLGSQLTYANVMATIAVFMAIGGTTYAATGGNFILGNPNSATSTTALSAPIAAKALQVTNTSTGAGATGLGLSVASGHPPFTVNSGTKVTNLNADKLDGLDSTALGSGVLGGVASNVSDITDDTRPLIGTSSSSQKGVAEFVAPTNFVIRNFAVKLDTPLSGTADGIHGLSFRINNSSLVCFVNNGTDSCQSGSSQPVSVAAGSLYSLVIHPDGVKGPVPTVHFGWRATP